MYHRQGTAMFSMNAFSEIKFLQSSTLCQLSSSHKIYFSDREKNCRPHKTLWRKEKMSITRVAFCSLLFHNVSYLFKGNLLRERFNHCHVSTVFDTSTGNLQKYLLEKLVGWLVVLGFNTFLTAKVISWLSVTHMSFLAFSHQY